MNEAALEQMMLSTLKKHPQLTATGQEDTPAPVSATSHSNAWADGGNGALQAITNTLAAFQKQ